MGLSLIDVVGLIEDAGIEVVFMESVQERIKGHDMMAYVRRVYKQSFLENEIAWLKNKRKVKTIGVYSVTQIEEKREVEGKGATIAVASDGIQIRWAYAPGV